MSDTAGTEGTQPLTTDERAELERLRAENAALAAARPSRTRGRGRWAGAIALMLVAALIAPLSAVATWTHSNLLDTDEYVAMVAPLAENPAVQQEISARITDAVFEALRVEELTTQTLQAIGERPRVEGVTERLPVELDSFAEPITNAIHGFTLGQVSRLVASDTFAGRVGRREPGGPRRASWPPSPARHGRGRHRHRRPGVGQPRAVHRGDQAGARRAGGAVRGPHPRRGRAVRPAREPHPRQRPDRPAPARPPALGPAGAGDPALLAAGVLLAPSRRRGLLIGASMVVVSLVLLLLSIQVARALYLDDLESALLVPQVGQVLFDTVSMPLRLWVRSAAVLFLVIAIGAWVAGPSSAAAAVRSVPGRLAGATRRPTGALGSVSRFAHANTTGLRVTVGGLAVLAVLVGDRPERRGRAPHRGARRARAHGDRGVQPVGRPAGGGGRRAGPGRTRVGRPSAVRRRRGRRGTARAGPRRTRGRTTGPSTGAPPPRRSGSRRPSRGARRSFPRRRRAAR